MFRDNQREGIFYSIPSWRSDLNRRSIDYKSIALPLSYTSGILLFYCMLFTTFRANQYSFSFFCCCNVTILIRELTTARTSDYLCFTSVF